MAFMRTQAPNGQAWEAYTGNQTPNTDSNGFVCGPWGECIHYAVQFECQQPQWQSMPEYQDDGPAGQVIAAGVAKGGDSSAFDKNESATRNGWSRGQQGFVFQQAAMGQPIPHHPGAPGSGPVVIGTVVGRFEQAQQVGHLPGNYSQNACSQGASILDEHELMPEKRPYRDTPFAVCFCFVTVALLCAAGYFMSEIPPYVRRLGTTWNSQAGSTCGMTLLEVWPDGTEMRNSGLMQRMSNTTGDTSSGRLLSAMNLEDLDADVTAGRVQLEIPGLSAVVRRLEAVGVPVSSRVVPYLQRDLAKHGDDWDNDEEDEEDMQVHSVPAPAPPRRLASRRRSNRNRAPAPPPESDCERACAAFEECGAFEVDISRSIGTTCRYFQDEVPMRQPTQTFGATSACWQKYDEVNIDAASQSFLGMLFGLTVMGSLISMFIAMCFVKWAAMMPSAATYTGIYGVPICMIIIGLVLAFVIAPLLSSALMVFGLLFVCMGSCLLACMCYCYRSLIPLTIEVVDASANVIATHWSMFGISLCGSCGALLWSFICGCLALGLYGYSDRSQVTVPYSEQVQMSGTVSYVVYFLYFIVYFWGGYTAFNTCHTAYCGVFGRWYFGKMDGKEVSKSLKIACGPSFGSVALGSLIIAVIRAMEQLMKKIQNDAEGNGNILVQIIACVMRCIISIIGDIVEWISSYIYVQVALRGLSFMQGAKATYALATISNLMFVCSAILVEYVAILGSVLCALGAAGVTGVVGYYTCGLEGLAVAFAIFGGLFGCIGGCIAGGSAVGILNSGSVSILMCWAERPDVLQNTNKHIADKFEEKTRAAYD